MLTPRRRLSSIKRQTRRGHARAYIFRTTSTGEDYREVAVVLDTNAEATEDGVI